MFYDKRWALANEMMFILKPMWLLRKLWTLALAGSAFVISGHIFPAVYQSVGRKSDSNSGNQRILSPHEAEIQRRFLASKNSHLIDVPGLVLGAYGSILVKRKPTEESVKLVPMPETFRKNIQSIDAVITYCNGSEPHFMQALAEALKEHASNVSYASSFNRFEDHDDLRILLRSIEKYGQIFRNIFLVVADAWQVPQWLNRSNARLKVIFHKQIWQDKAQLPVFNSLAIEANLHRIPDLSEYFVYFNDDLALLNPITFADFFTLHKFRKLGSPFEFTNLAIKVRTNVKISDNYGEPKGDEVHWVGPGITTKAALNEVCDAANKPIIEVKAFGNLPNHVPHLLMKSVLQKAEKHPALKQLFAETSGSKFRNGRELNTVMTFNGFIQCALGETIFWSKRSEMLYVGVNIGDERKESQLAILKRDLLSAKRKMRARLLKFLCVNDISDSGEVTQIGKRMADMTYEWRNGLFPDKSSFEQ